MNVTYLLGAGASANSLPIINNFEFRLTSFLDHLKAYKYNLESGFISFYSVEKHALDSLIGELEWLIKESRSHQTIDTLAKKFYHQGGDFKNLLRLKALLIIFFTYEQSVPNTYTRADSEQAMQLPRKLEKVDKRYDSFVASLIKNEVDTIELLDDVKILTWNYDLQFELAFKNYVDDAVYEIQKKIQSIPNRSSINNHSFDYRRFGIVKLNGIALPDYVEQEDNHRTFFDLREINNNEVLLQKLIELYKYYKDNIQATDTLRLFNYCWEANPKFLNKYKSYDYDLEVAVNIANETDALVVIGYSFPFFNREIDRKIIGSLNPGITIYIQDVAADDRLQEFDSSFREITGNVMSLVPVRTTSSFYLPPEL